MDTSCHQVIYRLRFVFFRNGIHGLQFDNYLIVYNKIGYVVTHVVALI